MSEAFARLYIKNLLAEADDLIKRKRFIEADALTTVAHIVKKTMKELGHNLDD